MVALTLVVEFTLNTAFNVALHLLLMEFRFSTAHRVEESADTIDKSTSVMSPKRLNIAVTAYVPADKFDIVAIVNGVLRRTGVLLPTTDATDCRGTNPLAVVPAGPVGPFNAGKNPAIF